MLMAATIQITSEIINTCTLSHCLVKNKVCHLPHNEKSCFILTHHPIFLAHPTSMALHLLTGKASKHYKCEIAHVFSAQFPTIIVFHIWHSVNCISLSIHTIDNRKLKIQHLPLINYLDRSHLCIFATLPDAQMGKLYYVGTIS